MNFSSLLAIFRYFHNYSRKFIQNIAKSNYNTMIFSKFLRCGETPANFRQKRSFFTNSAEKSFFKVRKAERKKGEKSAESQDNRENSRKVCKVS